MVNPLSLLGIIHTAISVIALIPAIVALIKYGRINPSTQVGKAYVILTAIACVTSLPIMKTGHPTAGHGFAVAILILLPLAIYANKIAGTKGVYLQTIAMSTTLFLSMIPAVVETFTRVPLSHPLATSPDSPAAKGGVLLVLALYLIGTIYQVLKIRNYRKLYQYQPELNVAE